MIEVNRIYHEHCLVTMARMEDKSIDLIITDTPYGVNKAEWDSEFPTFWIQEAIRVSKKMLIMPGNLALAKACKELEAVYRDLIILHAKNGMTKSKISFGNFIPVIATGDWKWKARPNHIEFNVKINEKIDHPTPKPKEAMLKLLEYYKDDSEIIYDPFLVSGTTAVACLYHGLNWIASEIKQCYVDFSNKRIKREQSILKLNFAA